MAGRLWPQSLRETPEFFVFETALHLTKRELLGLLFTPRFWVLLTGVSLVLGLAGPFGTYDGMRLAARIAYWLAMAGASYLVGAASVTFLAGLFSREAPAGLGLHALFGAVAGLPVAGVVWALNLLAGSFETPMGLVPLVFYCVAISAVVAQAVAYVSRPPAGVVETPRVPFQPISPAGAGHTDLPRPRIVERLPLDRRGKLSHLSVQDHYVDVRTDRGGGLILIRLSDAILETEGTEGMRIHRSHWVARTAIVRCLRRDGRLSLELTDGTILPVSRSCAAAVRAAGFG